MMKKFFSVFMALTVSVGLCVSSYAEQQKPYDRSPLLDDPPKYKENSNLRATDLHFTELKENLPPETLRPLLVFAGDALPLFPDACPVIIDLALYTADTLISEAERPTRITPGAYRLCTTAVLKIPPFLDDS